MRGNPPRPLEAIANPRDGRTQDSTVRWFWLFVLLHATVWTLVPTLTLANPPLDAIEMVQWGHQWQWGYHRHPPLPAWVAEAATQLAGSSPWALYLASQLATAVCLLAVWRLARRMLAPWPALAAVVMLEGCYFFSVTTPELNNNIIVRPFWALAVWLLWRAIQTDRWRWWLATGAALGLAMLSKYDTALLVASLLALAAIHPQARRLLRRPGPYLTAAVALALFAPHARWVVEHDFITLGHVRSRSAGEGLLIDHLRYPLAFLAGQVATVAPMLLIAVPMISWRARLRSLRDDERLGRAFLAAVVLGPPLLMLLLSAALGLKLRSMWASPLWTFLPVLLLYSLKIDAGRVACRRAIVLGLAMGAAIAIYFGGRSLLGPYASGEGSRHHFPGRQLAEEVSRHWHQRYEQPLPLVGGSYWTAGNVAYFSGERPEVYAELSSTASPWTSDEDFRRRGGVIVWQLEPRGPDDADVAGMVDARFPEAVRIEPVVIPWQTAADVPPIKFALAIVPPQE